MPPKPDGTETAPKKCNDLQPCEDLADEQDDVDFKSNRQSGNVTKKLNKAYEPPLFDMKPSHQTDRGDHEKTSASVPRSNDINSGIKLFDTCAPRYRRQKQ